MLDKSVMLDGDYIGAVNPFKIYDSERISYLYDTLKLLIQHHQKNGYGDFVINYVFEDESQLTELTQMLKEIDPDIYPFWVFCNPVEHENRVRYRNNFPTPTEPLMIWIGS